MRVCGNNEAAGTGPVRNNAKKIHDDIEKTDAAVLVVDVDCEWCMLMCYSLSLVIISVRPSPRSLSISRSCIQWSSELI